MEFREQEHPDKLPSEFAKASTQLCFCLHECAEQRKKKCCKKYKKEKRCKDCPKR